LTRSGQGTGERGRACAAARSLAVLVVLLCPLSPVPRSLSAQSRLWDPDQRTLVTDLSAVTAVAATRSYVFAATRSAIAVYDRGFGSWQQTVGALDGFPEGVVTVMVASPVDDLLWMGGVGRWLTWDSFGRRLDGGTLPGTAQDIALDANDPGAGAYFRVGASWFFVARGSVSAVPAQPPRTRIGPLSYTQLLQRVPAFDAIRFRIERDEQNRVWRLSGAAEAPLTGELYVATDGNGVFRLDPRAMSTDRLPSGLVGEVVGAIGSGRGQVCAGTDVRLAAARHGLSCFDESLGSFTTAETLRGGAPYPWTQVRQVLVTQRAVYAATDAGLFRAPRGRGDPVLMRTSDGLPTEDVRAVAEAPGGVWVGTLGGVAFVADTGRSPTVTQTVPGTAALALAFARDTLWVGTAAGLEVLMPLDTRLLSVTGLPQMQEPVVGIVVRGDSIVAALEARFLVRAGGRWQVQDPAGASIGRFTSLAPDAAGLWVSGTLGFAFYDPTRNVWSSLTAPGDVPLPVAGVAATRDYVWVATDLGVVRYERRVLVP